MHLFLPPKFTLFIPLPPYLIIYEFYKTCHIDDWYVFTCTLGKVLVHYNIFFAILLCHPGHLNLCNTLLYSPSKLLPAVYLLEISLPSRLFQKIPSSYWALWVTFLQLWWAKSFICMLVERTILWDVKLLMMSRFQASIFTCLRTKSISVLKKSFTRTTIRSKRIANQKTCISIIETQMKTQHRGGKSWKSGSNDL